MMYEEWRMMREKKNKNKRKNIEVIQYQSDHTTLSLIVLVEIYIFEIRTKWFSVLFCLCLCIRLIPTQPGCTECGCEWVLYYNYANWIRNQSHQRNRRRRSRWRTRSETKLWRLLSKPTDLILIHAYIMLQFNINNNWGPEFFKFNFSLSVSLARSVSLTHFPPFITIVYSMFKYRLKSFHSFGSVLCSWNIFFLSFF